MEKNNKWVWVLSLVLSIINLTFLGFVLYKNNFFKPTEQPVGEEKNGVVTQEEVTEEVETEKLQGNTYEGKAITATLPEGWEIKEFFDGEGHNFLTTGQEEKTYYMGLTGIQIYNGNKEIMELKKVPYATGIEGCEKLPRFSDNSPDYEYIMGKSQKSSWESDITYIDYTNTPFSEFIFLGMRVRRVSTNLYIDRIPNDEYFQPQCDLLSLSLGNLMSATAQGSRFFYTISEEANENELVTLDKILESMKEARDSLDVLNNIQML